ncbi:hypothetical protein C5C31_07340 [Rathayibacter rathayi]|uniref:Uncharacterized protein n=1 Tax=Rathayibacter rathayi TaxID=33887 RepID=A0ABD6W8S9_RATRA|nr:hypothetical protein [Rathayibacter rathayi]PPF14021.1 hypothetical protein C5C04_07915 [Rathayibacter rathayi]PPG13167.1 hypothetical protein C5C11_07520 [Rathayibacter rathayi]PPG43504.1 hypothetical protein C5C20_08625 [Rathayibacter rathayi]PPH23487.1 hypothetical protein C5C31_07340 [Rathayibacter rathayi]PPH36110.1 hypothetical protein C5C28_06045 [Rathayibacter rathayi]
MIRRRLLWAFAIAVTVVLWAAVLALPVVVLLLPNQYQGDSVTVPPELFVRQALGLVAPPLQTAALVMLGSLIVIAVARRPPARVSAAETTSGWDDAVF